MISDAPPNNHQYIEAQTLNPVEAGQVILDALAIVNEKQKDFKIVYMGQPCGGLKQVDDHLRIAAKEPLDLAIEYPEDGKRECFDFINVVPWVAYDPNVGRLTTGFKSPEKLAAEISAKLAQHLSAKENDQVLISSAGSKYSIKSLTNNTLSIDEQGYLRMNNKRLWSQKGGPLMASSFRSDEIIHMEESNKRINFVDKNDPAPMFYIDLMQTYHPTLDDVPDDKKADAKEYNGDYLLFLREPGKI